VQAKKAIFVLIRLLVAVAFIIYGMSKLLGGQFIFNRDWVIDGHTTDGTTMVWTFYGYSPIYGRLIGLTELGPALMLLLPRTRLLGALALFAVSANITVMDFCFDFPGVKYVSLFLTVLCGILIVADWRKMRLMLWSERQLHALEQAERDGRIVPRALQAESRRGWVVWAPALLLASPLILCGLNVLGDVLSTGPDEAAFAHCTGQGWRREDLRLQSWRGTGWGAVNRRAVVIIQTTGSPPRTIRVEVFKPHGFSDWRVTGYQEN
jgi:hypothetical protein